MDPPPIPANDLQHIAVLYAAPYTFQGAVRAIDLEPPGGGGCDGGGSRAWASIE